MKGMRKQKNTSGATAAKPLEATLPLEVRGLALEAARTIDLKLDNILIARNITLTSC